jgi:MYXO-CTERM domain-containing protein
MNATALLLSLTLAATTNSKLGGYFARSDAADSHKVVAACPRLAVFVLPDAWAINAIVSLASNCPDTKVVVRVRSTKKFTVADDPVQAATAYWNTINGDLATVTGRGVWLEGPNEVENIPDWTGSAANAEWAAKFFAGFADLASGAGYAPIVGAIRSGSPKLAGELTAGSENLFKPIATAMKAKAYPWGWSYHAFSAELVHSSFAEADTTLRYRRIRTECALQGIPLFITAAGQGAPGWLKAGTTPAAYLEWMDWLDARLEEDSDVQGAALYQFGGTAGTEPDYALASVADGLVALLASTAARDAGIDAEPPDASSKPAAGRDASSGGGGHIPPGGGGVPAPERQGCSTVGAGSGTALAALAAYLFRRRRRD